MSASTGSVTDLRFEDDSFDLVLCLEVIEHVDDPARAVRELARVAGRHLVVSVPHEPWFRLGSLLRGKHVTALGNHPEHVNHFNPRSLRALLEGFAEVTEVRSAFPWLIASCRVLPEMTRVSEDAGRSGTEQAAPERAQGKVVVVMPARNAARTLARTVEAIPREWVDEVIIVDDNSTDNTLAIARRCRVHVVWHPHNVGYGGNQKTCYLEALQRGADVVVMLHPDGQYEPSLIPSMIEPILAGGADLVLGSRFLIRGAPRRLACRTGSTPPTDSSPRRRTEFSAPTAPSCTPATAPTPASCC